VAGGAAPVLECRVVGPARRDERDVDPVLARCCREVGEEGVDDQAPLEVVTAARRAEDRDRDQRKVTARGVGGGTKALAARPRDLLDSSSGSAPDLVGRRADRIEEPDLTAGPRLAACRECGAALPALRTEAGPVLAGAQARGRTPVIADAEARVGRDDDGVRPESLEAAVEDEEVAGGAGRALRWTWRDLLAGLVAGHAVILHAAGGAVVGVLK